MVSFTDPLYFVPLMSLDSLHGHSGFVPLPVIEELSIFLDAENFEIADR